MNHGLRFLLVAVLGGVFLGILGAVLGIEFVKNIPILNQFFYRVAWALYGAFLWDVINKKE